MSGSLLCEYVLSQKQAAGKIPADGQVVKSIVSTNLIDAVAKAYGAELIEVLTGFKWIGNQSLKNETTGHGTYPVTYTHLDVYKRQVLWSLDSLDWNLKDTGKIIHQVLKDVKDLSLIHI